MHFIILRLTRWNFGIFHVTLSWTTTALKHPSFKGFSSLEEKSLRCFTTWKRELDWRNDVRTQSKMQVQHCLAIYKGEGFKVIDWERWKVTAAAEERVRGRGAGTRHTPETQTPPCSPKTEAYIRRFKNTPLAPTSYHQANKTSVTVTVECK